MQKFCVQLIITWKVGLWNSQFIQKVVTALHFFHTMLQLHSNVCYIHFFPQNSAQNLALLTYKKKFLKRLQIYRITKKDITCTKIFINDLINT